MFGENRRLLSIEEVFPTDLDGDGDLPDAQDFSDPMDVQEQYRRAMLLDGCDGFGSPAELASALLRTTGRECLEAEAHQTVRWGQVDILDEDSCPSSPSASSLTMQVWPTPAPPQPDSAHEAPAFSPMRLARLPSLEMDMDVSDVSDDEEATGGLGMTPQEQQAIPMR